MEAAGYQQQPTLLAPLLSLANPQQPFEPNNGGGSSGGDWTTVLCDLRRSVSNLVLYVLESMPVPWLLTSATTTSAPPPMLPPTPAPATAPSATVTQPPSYQLQEVDELDDGGKRARRFNWPDAMTQSLPLHPPPPPPLPHQPFPSMDGTDELEAAVMAAAAAATTKPRKAPKRASAAPAKRKNAVAPQPMPHPSAALPHPHAGAAYDALLRETLV